MLGSMETVLLMLLIVPLGPRRQLSFSMVRFPLDFYFRLLGGLQLFFQFYFLFVFFHSSVNVLVNSTTERIPNREIRTQIPYSRKFMYQLQPIY